MIYIESAMQTSFMFCSKTYYKLSQIARLFPSDRPKFITHREIGPPDALLIPASASFREPPIVIRRIRAEVSVTCIMWDKGTDTGLFVLLIPQPTRFIRMKMSRRGRGEAERGAEYSIGARRRGTGSLGTGGG